MVKEIRVFQQFLRHFQFADLSFSFWEDHHVTKMFLGFVIFIRKESIEFFKVWSQESYLEGKQSGDCGLKMELREKEERSSQKSSRNMTHSRNEWFIYITQGLLKGL